MSFSGTISLAGNLYTQNMIAATGSEIVFDISSYKEGNDIAIISDMSKISGAAGWTVTVNADQALDTYVLAGGAEDFDKFIAVTDTEGISIGTMSVGTSLAKNGVVYTLNRNEGLLSLNLETVTKEKITITAESAEKKYDGSALTAGWSYSGNLIEGDELFVTVDGSITDAGTAANKVTFRKVMRGVADVTDEYDFADSIEGVLTVTKRNVTMTSADDAKFYDGTPLTNHTVTVTGDGFASGEGAAYEFTGTQTDVGSSDNYFTYALNDGTKAENYNITSVEGKLEVTQAEVPKIEKIAAEENRTLIRWIPASETEATDVALAKTDSAGDRKMIVRTGDCAIETYSTQEEYNLFLRRAGSDQWSEAITISENPTEKASSIVSNRNGVADIFFAKASGLWNQDYAAQHIGSLHDWGGTLEEFSLTGKNMISDTFEGSSDANILLLTDDDNGDALFVENIYTEFPSVWQSRIAQIDEIRAGAGDDIVDMTSQLFEYSGDGMIVRGGAGNDTIWANKGNNMLFGDAGEDRLVGASGNDVIAGGIGDDSMHGGGGDDLFCFCAGWGKDTVEQLADGTVTLWFAEGNLSHWNGETMVYTEGTNSVRVTGISSDQVTLKFGKDNSPQSDTLTDMGSFEGSSSEKIFEEKETGILACL